MSTRLSFPAALQEFFASARLASALSTASIGSGVFAWSLNRLVGMPGLIAMLAALIVLSVASLFARRASIEWTGLVPISLLLFVGWACVSVVWSEYTWATVGGLAYLLGFTVLGLYVALVRDTIQVVRSFGDVLRLLFVLSLALEVLSGLLIDTPISFLNITAQLDQAGPISGMLGNRNELGLLTVVATVCFVIEWRTRSVSTALAVGSISVALLTLLLTKSPIAWGTAAVALGAAAVLYGIRRLPMEQRGIWQYVALGLALATAVLAWVLRSPIVAVLNGGGELNYRLGLWREVWALIPLHSVEGWGWVGQWNTGIVPFSELGVGTGRPSVSAVNAYLDVWFQLGIVGLAAFLLMVGLAFVRSWLLAVRQRTVVYTWPAIVLAALVTASLAESSILIEFGWLTFVICCVKASQTLSWRVAFKRPLEQEPLD